MANAYYNNYVAFGTRIHTFEFHPSEMHIALTEGVVGAKERLTDIKHGWFEKEGFTRVAGLNAQFFGTYTMGLQFVDSGFLTQKNTIDDQFLELILDEGKLKIDNITHDELTTKYPKANWAAGVGFSLVRNGKIDLLYANKFSHAYPKNPRSAIGQKENGYIVLMATDGRGTGSEGLTGSQLATVMLDLGCVTAISLDGGGSSQMNVNMGGTYDIKNRLDGNWQRPITSAFVVYGKDVTVIDNTVKDTPQEFVGNRNFSALYAHLDNIYVKEGDLVTPKLLWSDATKIGRMGSTGMSTAPHLHFGVVEGIQKQLWRLKDMYYNNPKPSKQQTEFFLDSTLFDTTIHTTVTWLGYENHYAYDVVPQNRHLTSRNYDIMWNRSFAGRVIKTGFDSAYGNYVIIWYNIL